MSIRVRFACGHLGAASETATSAPVCPCGETRIARVQVRPPRFVGACSGPYAETKALDPAVVNVAPAGALPVKTQE